MMNSFLLKNKFSDAAADYESLSALQQEIALELLKKFPPVSPQALLLDIGMGTGWLTQKIQEQFPWATVVGLDFAKGMLDAAQARRKGLPLVQADARRLPFKGETFDGIVSNLMYQWIPELEEAFKSGHGLLKKGGSLAITLFGKETLGEVFAALARTLGEKAVFGDRLPDCEKIVAALEAAEFKNIQVEKSWKKMIFADLVSLLKWTKDIGANALGGRPFFMGKDFLKKFADDYAQHYQKDTGVESTFEVIWVKACK